MSSQVSSEVSSEPKQQDFHDRLEVAVRTIVSPIEYGRSQNEDNYLVIDAEGCARYMIDQHEVWTQIDGWPAGHIRLAILDGMGGHSNGRQATENTVTGMLAIPAASELKQFVCDLEALHLRLHRQMHIGDAEPGCTLTVLDIPPSGSALLFHVSDSRLYAIGEDEAVCLTVDHVPATKFAMRGLINEEEWYCQVHEQSGYQIAQAFVLGNTLSDAALYSNDLDERLYELHDGNLPPFLRGCGDRRLLPLERGKVYLLASDGLWHLPHPRRFIQRWSQILGRHDKPLKAMLDDLFVELIRESNEDVGIRGDNSTAIAFRLF